MSELLVVPALLAYGEAAFAYAGELRSDTAPYGVGYLVARWSRR